MKKYTFLFTGRQTGAIGIFYKISQDYEAQGITEALTKLFIDYEHITGLKLNGKDFKIEAGDLDHKETLKNYKGLGSLRK